MGTSPEAGREAEHVVAMATEAQLPTKSRMWANLRVADDARNSEVDLVVAMPDAGFVCVEVKGGQVTSDGGAWNQTDAKGQSHAIDPVGQALRGMYALQRYVEADPRWGSRGRVRWANAVVFPFTKVPEDFSMPDCPRHMIFGREDLQDLVQGL